MKILLILMSVVLVIDYALTTSISVPQWNQFKLKHNKSYKSQEEEQHRLQVFTENLQKIEAHNILHEKGFKTYKLGVNKFADLTVEEFKKFLKLQGKNPLGKYSSGVAPLEEDGDDDLPESVDWRDSNAINDVKDQGACGSCWAFCSIDTLESRHFLKTGNLYLLSVQELVDCGWETGNMGCNGGIMDTAYDYIIEYGISQEKNYPYTAVTQKCNITNIPRSNATVKSYFTSKPQDEYSLQRVIATTGPTANAIDASYFQFYESGILYEWMCQSDLEYANHGVTVIGYGTCEEGEYWLVKNSWGELWGEDGYVRMARNRDNNCGIASDAVYPNL